MPSNTKPSPQHNTHQIITKSKAVIFKPKVYIVALVHKESNTIHEALYDHMWLAAMTYEYNALINNGTWSLVPRTADHKVVGNKWVYKVKCKTDDSPAKYNARLVAKCFQQIVGVNCFKTFSPMIKPAILIVVLSLVSMNQWTIRQVDINNVFLNGDLTEEVFMEQPVLCYKD